MIRYALVDCNNFYVSCERLFNPAIEGRPVIVLSNNDGCVVARSAEAKKLGIGMGDPFFKIKDFCRQRGVFVYSSNYQLYGDISMRVMQVLSEMAPEIEVYSIDEAFLKFPASMSAEEVFSHCQSIRQAIKKLVGIPTSIGIGPTKTLAKVAIDFAKTDKIKHVYDLSSPALQETILKKFLIGDVWGIGSQYRTKLRAIGIYTAWELREAEPTVIRRRMGVVGERILWELKGLSCLPLEEAKSKKSIAYSRSFGQVIIDQDVLAEALSTYVANACVKLRKQESCAQALCIYLETKVDPQTALRQTSSKTIGLPSPTNDTPYLITAAKQAMTHLYREGQSYKKCGVILLDLINEFHVKPDLFMKSSNPKRRHLAAAVDELNTRFGKGSVFYGAMGVNAPWEMQCDRRSRRYTTCWNELAIAKA